MNNIAGPLTVSSMVHDALLKDDVGRHWLSPVWSMVHSLKMLWAVTIEIWWKPVIQKMMEIKPRAMILSLGTPNVNNNLDSNYEVFFMSNQWHTFMSLV